MILCALLLLVLLSSACSFSRVLGIPQDHVQPDPLIPHQVSRDMTIPVWVNGPDGKLVEEDISVSNGDWWLCSGELLRTPPPTTTPSPKEHP